jgi:gluconate 2-dehydrogenase alpha chain
LKGEEYFQPADMVLLATFTMNNVRLLLLSKIGEPYAPESGRAALGSNLTHQVYFAAATVFMEQPLNRFMGAGAAGFTISDFDGDLIDHSKQSFLRGGLLRVTPTGTRPIGNFGVLPPSVKATWGSDWKKASVYWFDRVGQINFSGEHLPHRANFMDLDPTYKDKYGDPLLRFTLDWQDNDRKMASFITPKAVDIARAMGAKEILPFPGLKRYDTRRYQTTHLQGGTVAGNSPDDSVLNGYSQHWQVPNLFVLGASAFPHNPGPNPTPTVLAMAYRTADAIVERYLKRPGLLV